MPFNEPLVAMLKANATVSAITTRVRAVGAEQGEARPYIVYRISTNEHVHSHAGRSRLAFGVFLVTCWHDDYDGAWTLAIAVQDVLDGLAKGTYSGTQYEGIFLQGMDDNPDPAIDGGSSSTKGVQLRFHVQYREN